MGRLDVRVCDAKKLPDVESFGKPDPYVILKVENQNFQTKDCPSTTEPRWEEVFKFTVADENSAQLRVEVWNKNPIRDDFMGFYQVSLAGLVRGEVKDEYFLLQQCKGNANAEIHLRICANDFGLPPTAAAPAAQPVQCYPSAIPSQPYQQPAQPVQPYPSAVPSQPYPAQPYPAAQPYPPAQPYPAAQPYPQAQPYPPAQPYPAAQPYPQAQPYPPAQPAAPYQPQPQPLGGPGAPCQPQYPPAQQPPVAVVGQPAQPKKDDGVFGSMFSAVGSMMNSMSNAVNQAMGTGACTSSNFLNMCYFNTLNGWLYLNIDGGLRPMSPPTFQKLFGRAEVNPKHMNQFAGQSPFPVIDPLPGDARLIRCGDVFLIDFRYGRPVRRKVTSPALLRLQFDSHVIQNVGLMDMEGYSESDPIMQMKGAFLFGKTVRDYCRRASTLLEG